MVLAKAAEPNFNEEYPLNKDVFVMDSFHQMSSKLTQIIRPKANRGPVS